MSSIPNPNMVPCPDCGALCWPETLSVHAEEAHPKKKAEKGEHGETTVSAVHKDEPTKKETK